ncbi:MULTISPECIES: ABC transporter ATP-binding protein [Methanobacterium]|uniref:ABC transporter ATP-binding protein n=1 Tax=Methanobacterium veterum TaxID=408577 RepID=A0A9E4ZZ83_9EURY|nr:MULTISPECIES: ABC transporter ATP-binding protein [Methanobacterium]MCZ3366047.1 ABC transporter ATP-binding protein [Methanobacterium veterum]MCZ3371725.1 ABC transporter ATP-binding protein [Methanobacterium veterum]
MSDTVMSLNNVHKIYGDFKALNGISLKVKKGQIFGYLGPNGSGKTTTIKLILGLIKPSSGDVRVLEQNPYINNNNVMQMRNLVGAMLEIDGLYEKLTGLQNILFWANLHNMNNQRARKSANEVIGAMNLSKWANVQVEKYSHGMRKRLAFARALVSDPQILILDEPTSGVDPESRYLIREMMKELAQNDKTIFFSSHDLDEVQKTCSNIAILNKGEVISYGALNDILSTFGARKLQVRLISVEDTQIFAKKLQNFGYNIKIDGQVISFYPKKDLNIFEIINPQKIVDTWKSESSLEEAYLNLVADNNR